MIEGGAGDEPKSIIGQRIRLYLSDD